jgi:hypothetical protein
VKGEPLTSQIVFAILQAFFKVLCLCQEECVAYALSLHKANWSRCVIKQIRDVTYNFYNATAVEKFLLKIFVIYYENQAEFLAYEAICP